MQRIKALLSELEEWWSYWKPFVVVGAAIMMCSVSLTLYILLLEYGLYRRFFANLSAYFVGGVAGVTIGVVATLVIMALCDMKDTYFVTEWREREESLDIGLDLLKFGNPIVLPFYLVYQVWRKCVRK